MIARMWRGWNRFWFDRVDGGPFGLARIGLCLAALQLWLGTVPLVRHYYSDAGEYPIAEARRWATEWVSRFLMPDALGSFEVTAVLFGLWGLALVAFLVGYRTRLAGVAAAFLTLWFHFRNPTFNNGGDEVLRLCSFYMAVGYLFLPPRSRALTLDRLRARGGDQGDSGEAGSGGKPGGGDAGEIGRTQEGSGARGARMPAWPLRLVQVQLSVVYVVAGFWKVVGPPWWDGSALYYALGNSAFSRFGAPDWAWAGPLFAGVTLSVAWWELLFPVLVGVERTRRFALLYGVVVHGGILAFMNIGVFPFIMVGLYPVFLKPREVRRLVRTASPTRWASA